MFKQATQSTIVKFLIVAIYFLSPINILACNNEHIPKHICSYVHKHFSSWRVVSTEDLSSDVIDFWLKNHAKKSPGFTIGKIIPGTISYAVLLTPKDLKDHRAKLLDGNFNQLQISD